MTGLLFDSVFITNRGFYIPAPVFEAGSTAVGIVLLLSVAAAWYFGRWARARQAATGQILPVFWMRLAILAVPVLLAFFAMGSPVSLEVPALKGFNFKGGIYMRDSLIGLWLALSVYTGAFIAEIVRAGILAISKGQTEAAYALGIRPGRTMSLVVLPQALRVIVPPAHQPVPQPHQELLARHRRGIHGRHRHARRHHAEPDGPGDGVHPAVDGVLPGRLSDHFRGHERL